jgi:hypothetical protein
MDLEWKEIYETLLEGVDAIDIFSYRLSDGSYIMAEELTYDEMMDVILIDLPISVKFLKNGQVVLNRWIYQGSIGDEDESNHIPVSLMIDNIVARSNTPINLKQSYIKYHFFDKLSNTLDTEEFNSVIKDLSSYDLDKKDTSSDPLMDMYNKRIQYPYWN